MKFIYFWFILTLNFTCLHSESWQEKVKDPANFYSIRQAYLDNHKISPKSSSILSENNDGEEEQFRRWEYIIEPRVYPSGYLPGTGYLLNELNKFNLMNYIVYDTLNHADWVPLESSAGFPDNGFSGRLNCIAFHPKDTNIIFVGSPSGGLWKTTNGGKDWKPKTDYLPSLGVSEIVINPQNPDIMYMATGDRDAAYFISNPYSYGLLKSTDGGESWDTTGLQHIFADQMTIQRVIIHPTQPNILLAAVTGNNGNLKGIWRTTDGGAAWSLAYGGAKYDIEFKPGDPNIVYASGYKYLIKSTDAGKNWSAINSAVLPTTDITSSKIAVSPANPHIVFVQYQNPNNGLTYGLYKSSDEGVTWVKKNSSAITIQAGYDWVLTLSPTDSNKIFYGGQYLTRSDNSGVFETDLANGHVDHHALVFRPGTNELFNCNDGGIYKSYDNGLSWENLNRGLQTFQYYRLGSSATNENFILTGAQDNGIQKHNNPLWAEIGMLADGTECLVDYTDTTIYYTAYQYGLLQRYGSGLGNFNLPPNTGNSEVFAWVTPYLIHPANPKILFIGAKDIYKTTNRGNDWTNYSNQLTSKDNVGGGMIRTMAISESDPDKVLYGASYVVLYKTTDAGNTWKDITSNLPTSAGCFDCSAISGIAVNNGNPNMVWVTMSGFSQKNKIFKTKDGGLNWENVSGNLPNVPVNCIIYEKNSKDALYIGTDLGVFFIDSTMTNWIPFMKGLPNVPVQELEIHYASRKIRAATFGRGLWESNLYGNITSVNDLSDNSEKTLYPNPVVNYIELPESLLNTSSGVTIYSSIGVNVYSGDIQKRINVSFLVPGMYFLKTGDKFFKFVKISN